MKALNLSPTRRAFLKYGLVASGAVLALGSGANWLMQSPVRHQDHYDTPFGPMLVLTPNQAEIFNALAAVTLPNKPGFPSAEEAQVLRRLDEELYFISASISDDFKLAIDALELLPIAYGQFSRFSKLEAADRLAFLQHTQETGSDTVRMIVANCRMVCLNLYYGHASTWNAIGYDGPFSGMEPKLSAQRRHYAQRIKEASHV